VIQERGDNLNKGLQDVFPEQKPIDRTFINTWDDDVSRRTSRALAPKSLTPSRSVTHPTIWPLRPEPAGG
jgi:hypothetical protein